MKLVPADYISEDDKDCQRLLAEHPRVAYSLITLINSYRDVAHMALEAMQRGDRDTADLAKSCRKKDTVMQRLGIPLLETFQDWEDIRKLREEAYSEKENLS